MGKREGLGKRGGLGGKERTNEVNTEGVRMMIGIASSAAAVEPCHPALLPVSLMLVIALRGREETVRQ